MNTSVNLTKRVKSAEGWRYYPAVMSANGRIRPDWVVVDVKTVREEKFSEGTYYLDQMETARASVSGWRSARPQSRLRMQRSAKRPN
jgi:hypothetical protein